MAERRNGSFPIGKRKHGSSQRGVMASPRGPREIDYLAQSQKDKQKIRELARKRRQFVYESETEVGYGNKNLPAYKHKQEIIDLVDTYKAIILGGPTGSGKSTQVPQFLLEAGYEKIYMLVPRRIIADGLHERLIEELSEHLGAENARQIVGVAHGERSEFSDESKIVVMTPNTFTRMELDIRQAHADDRVAIISDEIHEANLYTEIATGIAAQAVHENESWRLIAASATHNTASLQKSFSELNAGFVPAVNIEGRPFEVQVKSAPDDSPMDAYIHEGKDHEKTMIFTSGKGEIDHIIDETIDALEQQERGSSGEVVFRKLHGELNDIEMSHINDPVAEGQRLVIVSSPAGMSGITIPGVTLVITDGTINRSELDDDGVSGLTRRYLSKAEILQQIGRAGRDVPGGIGILARPTSIREDMIRSRGQEIEIEQMPFLALESRDEFGPPEIYHSNLSQVVLLVADLNRRFGDINPFIPHQVTSTDIISAEESLSRLGALDATDQITELGRSMNQFPVRPELSRGMAEVVKQNRPVQQLARAAFIVAALESGGLQDFSDRDSREWKSLLRPETTDDFMAQLDIALTPMPESPLEHVKFLEEHDLSYKRVQRTKKVTRKILRSCGLRLENIVVASPNAVEEDELRHDLVAGMIDLVYEKSRIINRQQHYQNIHGDSDSTQRFISGRSVVLPSEHRYVAGLPRWYETALKSGGRKRHNIVEQVVPVDAETISNYARQNELLTRGKIEAAFEGGRVVERYQPMFGSISAGKSEIGIIYDEIPEKSQNVLVDYVLNNPGQAQQALREVAEEIEYYMARLPDGELDMYLQPDAPELLTKKAIEVLIRHYARSTREAHRVDHELGRYVFSNNVSISRYFDDETRQKMQTLTPHEISVDNKVLAVGYINGQPYVNGAQVTVRNALRGKQLYLPDGREILVQISQPGVGKTRVSAHEL